MPWHLLAPCAALLMFPQLMQAFYSPALPDLASAYALPAAQAARLFAVHAGGFALGVLLWGWASDRIGRRPSLTLALVLCAMCCAGALLAPSFAWLLACQAIAGLAAAACSVVPQTLVRDLYDGPVLRRAYSHLGMALSASPAIGLYAGALLAAHGGYRSTLLALSLASAALCAWCLASLPETRPGPGTPLSRALLQRMLADRVLWRRAAMVALLNVAWGSYFALAPFLYERLQAPAERLGESGALLALAAAAGAALNNRLLARGWTETHLLRLAALLLAGGALAMWAMDDNSAFALAMVPVITAFGLAIPNLLGPALAAYADCRGLAGALFALVYYLLIGAGMEAVSAWGSLPGVLGACAAGFTVLLVRR